MFACFLETNFRNFASVVLLLFSRCMFLPSCFMVALFLVCFSFVLFLVLLSDYEKCFPCNSSVFLEFCWLKGSLLFQLLVFVLVCFSCVVCFHCKQLICMILCLCCLLFPFL